MDHLPPSVPDASDPPKPKTDDASGDAEKMEDVGEVRSNAVEGVTDAMRDGEGEEDDDEDDDDDATPPLTTPTSMLPPPHRSVNAVLAAPEVGETLPEEGASLSIDQTPTILSMLQGQQKIKEDVAQKAKQQQRAKTLSVYDILAVQIEKEEPTEGLIETAAAAFTTHLKEFVASTKKKKQGSRVFMPARKCSWHDEADLVPLNLGEKTLAHCSAILEKNKEKEEDTAPTTTSLASTPAPTPDNKPKETKEKAKEAKDKKDDKKPKQPSIASFFTKKPAGTAPTQDVAKTSPRKPTFLAGGIIEGYSKRDAAYSNFDLFCFDVLDQPTEYPHKAAVSAQNALFGDNENITVADLRSELLSSMKQNSQNMFHALVARGGPALEILVHKNCGTDVPQYCGSAQEAGKAIHAVFPAGTAAPRDPELDYGEGQESEEMPYDDSDDEDGSSIDGKDSQVSSVSECSFVMEESEEGDDEMGDIEALHKLTYLPDSDSEDGVGQHHGKKTVHRTASSFRTKNAEELIQIAGPLRNTPIRSATDSIDALQMARKEVAPFLSCCDVNELLAEKGDFIRFFKHNVLEDWAYSHSLVRRATEAAPVDTAPLSAIIPDGVPKEAPALKAAFKENCDHLWEGDSLLKVKQSGKVDRAKPPPTWDAEKIKALASIVNGSTNVIAYMVSSLQEKYPEMKKSSVTNKIKEIAAKDSQGKFWVVRASVMDQCGLVEESSTDTHSEGGRKRKRPDPSPASPEGETAAKRRRKEESASPVQDKKKVTQGPKKRKKSTGKGV